MGAVGGVGNKARVRLLLGDSHQVSQIDLQRSDSKTKDWTSPQYLL